MGKEALALSGEADVVAAWKEAVALSRSLGFGLFKEAALSGASSEAAVVRAAIANVSKPRCWPRTRALRRTSMMSCSRSMWSRVRVRTWVMGSSSAPYTGRPFGRSASP